MYKREVTFVGQGVMMEVTENISRVARGIIDEAITEKVDEDQELLMIA